jgi:hypothetical protein
LDLLRRRRLGVDLLILRLLHVLDLRLLDVLRHEGEGVRRVNGDEDGGGSSMRRVGPSPVERLRRWGRQREEKREKGREEKRGDPSDAHRAGEQHAGEFIRKGARGSGIAGSADLDGRGLCGDDLRRGTDINGV